MSTKAIALGQLPANFKPDCRIQIDYDAKINAAKIEVFDPLTGQPMQTSPLVILTALLTSMQGNINALASMAVQDISKQRHNFFALEGETKCRIPRCNKPVDDPIHSEAVSNG